MYVYTRRRSHVILMCTRCVRVYTNKYVKRMYIYTWWLCNCVCMCVFFFASACGCYICVFVYITINSMYTILSRIILIAYQASLLSDGIKSKISKLAKKKKEEKEPLQHTSWSGTRISRSILFWRISSLLELYFSLFFSSLTSPSFLST